MRVDLVVNRTARGHARDASLLDRMAALSAGRCVIHDTSSLDELAEAADAIAAADSRLVVLSGGDGTLMAGVTALASRFGDRIPPIAPLSAGTAGTVARNWGVVGDPLVQLGSLLRGPRRLTDRPSLAVAARRGAERDARVGFIFGTGLVANFFRVYEARGAPGYAGAARLVSRIFVESFVGGPMARRVLDPLPCQLQVDGRSLSPQAWSLVCAAVVPNLGIGMRLTYRAAEDLARPHLVASALPPRRLGPRAPRVLAGRSLGGPDLVDELVSTLRITFP
ncbi:MAG: diacylglycerol kinase family protein, partial [Polyangiaceae bacterium]